MMYTRLAAAAVILVFSAEQTGAQSGSQDGKAPAPVTNHKPPDSLKVAAVQFRSSRDLDKNVAGITAHIRRLGERGVRVAVFPECALTGYFEDAVKATTAERLAGAERQVADACREAGIYAVVGTPHREGEKLYNSATVGSLA